MRTYLIKLLPNYVGLHYDPTHQEQLEEIKTVPGLTAGEMHQLLVRQNYLIALQGMKDISEASYAVSKLVDYKPAENPKLLKTIEDNLHHSLDMATFHCNIQMDSFDEVINVGKANHNMHVATVVVQETVDAIKRGLWGVYDENASMTENFKQLEKTVDNFWKREAGNEQPVQQNSLKNQPR